MADAQIGEPQMSDSQSYEPVRELDDANCQNTTEVFQEHHPGVSRTPQECSKNTTEVPIKEPERNKENEQEKDNTYSVIRELREYLRNCLDDDRPEAIRTIMDYVDDGPDWWTKRPEEAISHYLDHQDELIDEVLRRSDTQEVEVDPADRSAYAGVSVERFNGIDGRRRTP